MKNIILAALLVLAIGGGVGYYLFNKPPDQLQSARPAFELSGTELFEAFENNEQAANQKYLDQVVQVTGQLVKSNTNENGQTILTLQAGSGMFGIQCELDPTVDHPTTNFQTGQTLTVKGICTGMLMDVVLVRCVVV